MRIQVASICLSSLFAFAQATEPPSKPTRVRPHQHNEIYVPYWTLEPGWHTGIELRNNIKTRELAVTPILRTTDGSEIVLPAVVVQPDEVTMVDLATELTKLRPDLIGMTGAYGSVVLRFNSPNFTNLYVGSMVHREGKPVAFHFDGAESGAAYNGGTTRESLWWLPEATADGHLIITNASNKPASIKLSLYDGAGTVFSNQITLGPSSSEIPFPN